MKNIYVLCGFIVSIYYLIDFELCFIAFLLFILL